MTIQMEFEFAAKNPVLNCVCVRKGKDNQYEIIGDKTDWWTEVFPFTEWVEFETRLNNKSVPWNRCYKAKIKGKIKYYFVEMPEW